MLVGASARSMKMALPALTPAPLPLGFAQNVILSVAKNLPYEFRPFAEFILSGAEGLRETLKSAWK